MKERQNFQLKAGALISYFAIAFNIIAGMIYTPWMIDEIGQSDYGLYTLANSLISLLLFDIGLSSATSRFVAKYRAENRGEEIPALLSAVYKLYLLIDAVTLVILLSLYVCMDRIYVNLTPTELEKFKVVFAIAGLYSLINFPCVTFNGILTAYEKFIPLKLADLFQRVATVILTIVALLCGMGLYALVAIHALCGLVAILIKFFFVQKSVKLKLTRSNKSIYRAVLGFSVWTAIYSLAQRLIFNITPTILGITVTAATSAIAVFGIISTIEGYCYTITTAVNGMFLSKITRLLHSDDGGEGFGRLAVTVGRYQYALNGLILVGFWLVGREFLSLWVGNDYAQAYEGILLVIIPGLFFNALQIFHTAMIVKNLVKYQAFIQIIMGVCNVILSFVFSYFWGVVGASLSIFAAYTLRDVLTLVLIRKNLNVSLGDYLKNCYLKMSIPIAVSGVICYFALRPFAATTWTVLLIKVAMILIIYLIALAVFGLTRDERRSIIIKLTRSA